MGFVSGNLSDFERQKQKAEKVNSDGLQRANEGLQLGDDGSRTAAGIFRKENLKKRHANA